MATLYEIDGALQELLENGYNLDCVDLETGEVDEAKAQQMLDALNIDRSAKLEGIACFIKNLSADVEALKKEEASLKERRQSKEKKIDSLKSYLSQSLLMFEQTKFESTRAVVSFRKSQAVEVMDQSKLTEAYLSEVVTVKPNLAAIKEAIKAGAVVEGATLIERQNIQIK